MSYLTDRSVKPVGPVFVFPEQKYSRVVVMKTTAANSRQYDVLFLLTGETLNSKGQKLTEKKFLKDFK